ncbi:hypothetical protein F5B20DRAFT_36765 [Whalleya microplaca]|nr:hypothetical protein F5B20DRAFT_36765 [Whalleya microplaca]
MTNMATTMTGITAYEPQYAGHHTAHGSADSLQEPDPLHEATLIDASLDWIPRRNFQSVTFPRLEKPVVIPRIGIASRLELPHPFLRAYSTVLRSYDIHEVDFVAMMDNLSVAQAASPPLQAIDMAGMVLGLVPNHWAQLASFGVRAAAGVGTAGISVARTKAFLDRVNRDYLNPRGLKVSLKKDDELTALLGLPEALLAPLSSENNSQPTSLLDRRMRSLAPYIAPLTTNVPPAAEQQGMMDKLSAKQVIKRVSKQEGKMQKKLAKEARKLDRKLERKPDRKVYRKVEAKQNEQLKRFEYLVIENIYPSYG